MKIAQSLNSAFDAYQHGNYKKAEKICKKILKKTPNNADALHLLGMIHFQRNDYNPAIQYINKALQIDPYFAEAFNNLGNIYQAMERFDEAVPCYKKAITLNLDLAATHMNLGIVLHDMGRIDEAISSYKKVTELNPSHYGAYNNLGLALHKQGKINEAMHCYQKALQANPSFAEAFNNLGLLLKEEGYLEEAIENYRQALAINPNYCDAFSNLGGAYQALGKISQAISTYKQALAVDEHYVDSYNNIGCALTDTGNFDEAERYFRKALQIQPDYSTAYSNTLLSMHYNNRYSPGSVFSAHIQFAEQFEKPLATHHFPHTNEPVPDRRLRIGYISPDFRRHSVAYFLEPVLSAHTHDNFEISCYSDVVVPDEMTKRFQGYSDHWEVISGQSDGEVAGLIQKHRIDILIDLSGHTAGNRLLVFAQKPAPVQASWIGYPATTGLSSLDYKIVDTYTDPPGTTEHLYSERLLRLPETFLCFLPDKDSPDIGPLPVLTTGHITFGSFNNFSKISPDVFRGWHTILKKVPAARLIMKAKSLADETVREYVMSLFRDEGITDDRVELLSWTKSPQEHLDLYNRIDIALDTFPYNGTTTTCEALWMGVPVVTLQGDIHASRVGSSLLSNVGLPKLIAGNQEEYVDISVALAHDRERLKTFRKSLRDLMARSPLTDSKRFTATLEMHYREIWRQWCETAS